MLGAGFGRVICNMDAREVVNIYAFILKLSLQVPIRASLT